MPSATERAAKINPDNAYLLPHDLETITEYMRMRPVDKNILRIKEELIALKQL